MNLVSDGVQLSNSVLCRSAQKIAIKTDLSNELLCADVGLAICS
jgi:hypothetical protein